LHGKEITYNPNLAKAYAEKHCKDYNHDKYKCWDPNNSKCENYGKGGGTDCANFMSQSLIDGGITFSDCLTGKGEDAKAGELVDGAVVIGKDNTTKGIRSANDLITALQNSYCFKEVGSSETKKEGDIAAWRKEGVNWVHHVAMVNKDGYYDGHTSDVCFDAKNEPKDYTDRSGKKHVVSFYRFQEDKCKKCELDEKTCEAEMESKCSSCTNCDTSTGECKSWCEETPAGRCTPGSMCMCSYRNGKEYCGCYTLAGGDCPDDTLTVASAQQTGEAVYSSISSQVGVLDTGYTYDMQKLLSSFNEAVRTVSPSDISQTLAKETPLLIIPTAGLHGMENSDFFKTGLNEYVNQGGSILVLSQQYGYEYSVLPGGLSGYGWAEDQSCQSNSSYIDTWHNVLASQTKTTPSLNVDGYFTKYPDDTTVLLRRTANGQPAVLMYQYGNGYVIASTAYTDTANTRGEASEDEKRLVGEICICKVIIFYLALDKNSYCNEMNFDTMYENMFHI
jgi:hypothetical protein